MRTVRVLCGPCCRRRRRKDAGLTLLEAFFEKSEKKVLTSGGAKRKSLARANGKALRGRAVGAFLPAAFSGRSGAPEGEAEKI